jgi:hypothetical protein
MMLYIYTAQEEGQMGNRYRHALEKLAGEPPTSKTALVCSLLPEIELALGSGKTRKQVWQRLADEGLDVTYETFHTIIRRARKRRRPTAATGRKISLRAPGGDEIAGELAHDPLVNLRKLEESRPGFHFRGTEDLDVLVYGKKDSREQNKR